MKTSKSSVCWCICVFSCILITEFLMWTWTFTGIRTSSSYEGVSAEQRRTGDLNLGFRFSSRKPVEVGQSDSFTNMFILISVAIWLDWQINKYFCLYNLELSPWWLGNISLETSRLISTTHRERERERLIYPTETCRSYQPLVRHYRGPWYFSHSQAISLRNPVYNTLLLYYFKSKALCLDWDWNFNMLILINYIHFNASIFFNVMICKFRQEALCLCVSGTPVNLTQSVIS